MRIGELAGAAGCDVETVRFYERKGLIDRPLRPVRGFRSYPPETLARLRFVREAKRLGFTLAEIDELLALKASHEAGCADMKARILDKRSEIEARIARLRRMTEALELARRRLCRKRPHP